MRARSLLASLACAPLVAAGVTACTGDAPSKFTGAAAAGEQLAKNSGCVSCHGADFKGGTGPPLVGLAGSTVKLADGTTRTADDAYLTAAIKTPQSEQVAGYQVKMPANGLSDEQVAQLVAFIKALGNPAP